MCTILINKLRMVQAHLLDELIYELRWGSFKAIVRSLFINIELGDSYTTSSPPPLPKN